MEVIPEHEVSSSSSEDETIPVQSDSFTSLSSLTSTGTFLSPPSTPSPTTQRRQLVSSSPFPPNSSIKWIPDEFVNECPQCNTLFSFFKRKHHCRNCGNVVCDGCSLSRVRLSHLGYVEPVRVCDNCAEGVLKPIEHNLVASAPIRLSSHFTPIDPNPTPTSQTDAAISFWFSLINRTHSAINFAKENASTVNLNQHLFQGVPNHLRPQVWPKLAESTELLEKNVGVYAELVNSIETQSNYIEQIKADINRTFPDHPFSEDNDGTGQKSLYNLLSAFSIFDPQVGYCQGMNFIAAVLLLHLDEENAFWLFVQLLKKYSLEGFFQDGAPLLSKYLTKFNDWLAKYLPELNEHLNRHRVAIEIFISQWLRTLYAYNFPLQLVERIWDVFLIEKMDFLLWVGLTVLDHCQSELMELGEMEIMSFFNVLPMSAFESLEEHLDSQS